LKQCIELNTNKFVIKILQAQLYKRARWANDISSSCWFPVVYMCQKLWKLVGSRQSYCDNNLAYFWPTR